MSEAMITCAGLGKTFFNQAENLVVLDGLDFTVENGDILAITGPSGSGKSTFLSLLGGLDKPTRGSLTVGSWDLSNLSERRLTDYRGSFVGFVFQFHYLLRDFSALENVALPAHMRGMPRDEALERAAGLLRDVGLQDRMEHFPSQLSGGERQRAAIARSLINDPPLLLADEPTGNLDATNAQVVRDLLFDLVQRRGATLILVTHDMGLAESARHRAELRDRRLVML
jgi:lipoprotein-releasing system ATP-binding protein